MTFDCRAALGVLAAFVLSCSSTVPAATPSDTPPRSVASAEAADTIFLVRHAEKADGGTDPALTDEGRERAVRLAKLLASERIARILSTDFQRTRDTAAPLAAALGIKVEIYDHRDLPAVAAKLRFEGGRILIVGHSNSTPVLVKHLGGDPGAPIPDTEYDRVYRVEMPSGKTTVTRY